MSASELYTKGARIWIADKEVVWRAAELLEDYKGQKQISIQYEDGEESLLAIKDKNNLPLLRNPDILIGENDLTSLSYLNEPEVLYNLHVRFCDRNIIYTYCGIVLVAINPYEQLPIYGADLIQAYSGQDLASMDPHIFAVAEEAFKRMSRFEQNQSIIVSGESGAGKTVSAKYAMRYFATVGGSQTETQIEKKVLASNPIMEAIGNAKTTRNDNSSRFGKYIEIGFNRQLHIIGANMRTYLLEKSRVVFQAPDERNYHIFYQVCASAGIPEFKDFHLDHQDTYFYTNQGENPTIRDVDDAVELGSTKEALSLLGISPKDQQHVFQIVAAILHFGNVSIRDKDNEMCEISKQDKHLGLFCRLLGIEESQMRMWLCNRQIMTVNETLTKPLTAAQARMSRDALAKHIYANLFGWIVKQINKSLHTTIKQHKFIGVLDIYGFETFEINSFEQFCINYANEKLQQQFNMHVFKLEQEEYVKEQIEWSFIDFYDNQPCIDLIENRLGLFDLLDEECKMPKGSDQNWCQKLYEKHLNKSVHFDKPRMSNIAFIIHHFADKVTYHADGFLEKNRDTILPEQINILKASEFELVAELFMDKPEGKKRAGSVNYTIKAARELPKPGNKEHKKSVGSQFRDSLHLLMQTLNATTPHYIRCIKPNDEKEPFVFEPKRAVEQLRACGVLETIRISAAGYPSRWTYNEFYQRYRVLAKFKDLGKKNMKKTCENILEKLISDPDKYRFGKTKIFFRAGQVAYMEKLRSDKLQACGVMIQKHIRGWLQRSKYRKIRKTALLVQSYGRGVLARRHALFLKRTKAATKIQKSWRGHRQRMKFNKVRSAAVRIQAAIRGFFGRRHYRKLLQNAKAVIIQSQVRAFLARRRFKKVIHGFILLQSHVRRIRAKKELKQLKIEAKSVEHIKKVNVGLENKIIELQQKLDVKAKDVVLAREKETQVIHLKTELEKFKEIKETARGSSNRVTELERELELLRAELTKEKEEKTDLMKKKSEMKNEHDQVMDSLLQEKGFLKEHLDAANEKIKAQDQSVTDTIKQKVEAANQLVVKEFESERGHHQRLVKEYGRLQQRLENLQSEMQVVTGGHKRTLSDLSMISLESEASVVDNAEKSQEERESSQDQGYGTAPRQIGEGVEIKRKESFLDKVINEVAGDGKDKNIDIGLVLKLQSRIKELEKEKNQYRLQVDRYEDQSPKYDATNLNESAFDALKKELGKPEEVAIVLKLQKRVQELEKTRSKLTTDLSQQKEINEFDASVASNSQTAMSSLKMQELENENDKVKRALAKLNKAIGASTNFEKTESVSPAGKEFLDQFEAMTDELERRRDECLNLRAILAEQNIGTHAIAKEYYGGDSDLLNEDQELAVAYKSQKDLNRLLEKQLQKTELDTTFKEKELKREIEELKRDNDRQQRLIGQNLSLTPEAKIEATMQHEITRLTSENLDLRETIEKQTDQLRKLKKMLKVYAKRLKEGEAAEIVAEIEQDEQISASSNLLAAVKHREREYIGMLEYKREDEPALIKNLIMNLKPTIALGALPGLPAYIIFMCVRHTDYINDDEKVRSLLSSTISGIKRVIKKYHDDIEYLIMWIANTCRLLHTLKQYSGEKAFQSENSGRQNEHCLRNFDLSEYRLVFSDHAVWIYQSLIKVMEETIQPMIVPAVLEHEAIAGLTGSKPTGLRGRSSSTSRDFGDVYSLDSLMKSLNKFMKLSIQHALDPELCKQIFRQLYYFICAGALNNLLLRKDMCNWSKGMQIRYNLSHLEQWLRENRLQESGAHLSLDPIIQASQLLQARKTIADVDSIAEMCSKLTLSQIVKILNLYTPVDEFEERVPISFIRKIQEKLKHRQDDSNVLLMDTKFAFPVTFPFNPSSVMLESLQVPEQFHLGFLKRT